LGGNILLAAIFGVAIGGILLKRRKSVENEEKTVSDAGEKQ
jgi:hypothetical protein